MIARALALAAVIGIGLQGLCAPPRTPEGILNAALKGSSSAFEGAQQTRVWTDTGSLTTDVRVWGNGKGAVRSEYRSGAAKGAVVLRVGDRSWSRTSAGVWTALPAHSETARAKLILANYRVSLGAAGTLAGRSAVPLNITAKYAFNPSRKMWVDAFTGLILRDDLFAPDGKPRSSTKFTSVTYKAQSASLFQQPSRVTPAPSTGPNSLRSAASASEAQKLSGRPTPKPAYVPTGYRAVSYGLVRSRRNTWMTSVRYEDGLGAFTIFERNQGGPGGGYGPGQGGRGGGGPGGGRGRGGGPRGNGGGAGFGPPTATGRTTSSDRQQAVVNIGRPSGSYLLVGDISLAELVKVAESL